LGAEVGDGVERDLAEARVVAPRAECGGGADDEGGEGERDQKDLETDVGAGGEPVDDVARGLGGLVGFGLHVAEEESEHEERGGRDEEEFDGGDGAFDEHGGDLGYFVLQSTVRRQVGMRGRWLIRMEEVDSRELKVGGADDRAGAAADWCEMGWGLNPHPSET
jgi:hypothetical protein